MKTESLILSTAARLMLPLLLLFSVFLLLRGHYEPGGGFIGGLVAAAAFALYATAFGVDATRGVLRIDPRVLIGAGVLVAAVSGMFAWVFGNPYLTDVWLERTVPVIGTVGTPLIFDIGVYFVVLGVVLKIIFVLAEDTEV